MEKLVLGLSSPPPGTLQMLWWLFLTIPWLGDSVPGPVVSPDPLQYAQGSWDSTRRNRDGPHSLREKLALSFPELWEGHDLGPSWPHHLFLHTPAWGVSWGASWGL